MARKQKAAPKPWRRKLALWLVLLFFVTIGGLLGYTAINANTLHLRRAEVAISDLPHAFDGKTILYISDIDLCGINTPEKAGAAVMALQSAHPDILLLGGDYTSTPLLELLNRTNAGGLTDAQRKNRADFFLYIRDFVAPFGKFAIAAPDDQDLPDLEQAMTASGIKLLNNNRAAVSIDEDHLWLAGICRTDFDINSGALNFRQGDCVICAACTPACFPQMMVAEASDGGHWVDLALSGHTHGGQVRLFGRNIITLASQEQEYLYGWTRETGVPMLTTSGLGCEGINLRLESSAEAWLITLRQADATE